MRMKAAEAWRTSVAPVGLNPGTSRPLPKLSAALARRLIGRTWLRMKMVATMNRTMALPIDQEMKIVVVGLDTRLVGAITRNTPRGSWTRISTFL